MINAAGMTFFLSISALAVAVIILMISTHNDIKNLQHRVSCLERPHGESSTAGVFKTVNGKRTFVVTQPAHRTDC